jgi:cytochrome c-type biogenesis protein
MGGGGMNAQNVTLPLALVAGLLSFFSPCILPLVPVYMGYLTGTSVAAFEKASRRNTLLHALFFVLGFGVIFVLLGVAAGLIGQVVQPIIPYVVKAGGAILIIFGLHLTGLISIPFLNLEKRLEMNSESRTSYWASLLVGMIFAAGWTPCVGPILSAILLMAASSKTVANGALLLTAYTVGLGVPFLIVAALVDVALPLLRKMNRHTRVISIVAGVLLIIMGFLLVTGLFDSLLFWLNANIRI